MIPFQSQNDALPLGGGDWTNVIIPGDLSSLGFHHRKTYLITQLFPDSEYECLVQARNRFGWSEASRLFRFYTSRRGEEFFLLQLSGNIKND